MPNFDGGHYFLTALIPISTDTLVERDGQRFSPIQVVRKALATLPTALQTWTSEATGLNSPFSRNARTHFARFVVVEDVMYNGRDPEDPIKASIAGTNPVLPQSQDTLSCPFLLFVADFDAESGEPSELISYLEGLWKTMKPELIEVFGHCVGFEKVTNSVAFASYIQDGQIETTMSFNDYWTSAPPLKSQVTTLIAVPAGLAAVGACVGYRIAALTGAVIGILVGLLVGLTIDYFIVMIKGSRPFPPAPNTELPTILKALYLQKKFTEFAIEMQGQGASELYAKFTAFLTNHQPDELTDPRLTQPPGVI